MSATSGTPHFVIGTGRCGSTLLHEMLCRHRDVGFMSNLDDRLPIGGAFNRWSGDLYRALPNGFTAKGRLRFAPSEGYLALEREIGGALVWARRDLVAADATPWLADRFRSFMAKRQSPQAEQVFVHKFTGWPRSGFLQAVFPEARFVHVVRDGRAVANSWLQMPWWMGYRGPGAWQWGELSAEHQQIWSASGESFPVLAGLGWSILIEAWLEARDELAPGSWLDVRYEDLLDRPHDVMNEVTRFFGLGHDPEFASAVDDYQLDRSRAEAYADDLGGTTTGLLTSIMGPQLAVYGYETSAAPN